MSGIFYQERTKLVILELLAILNLKTLNVWWSINCPFEVIWPKPILFVWNCRVSVSVAVFVVDEEHIYNSFKNRNVSGICIRRGHILQLRYDDERSVVIRVVYVDHSLVSISHLCHRFVFYYILTCKSMCIRYSEHFL